MNVPLERLLLKWSLWTLDCKKKRKIVRGASQSAIIGYFLDKDYNGKGYMTQATKLFVTYAFTKLNLHRIQAEVQPYNVGSIRVLEKSRISSRRPGNEKP